MHPIPRLAAHIVFALGLLAGAQAQTFRVIKLPNPDERVTGIYCMTAKACVISTDAPSDPGSLYATDGQKITATLLTGNSKLAESLGTLGTVGFMGFSKVGDCLIAHVNGAAGGFVSATGNITQPSAWKAVPLGNDALGLNQQMGFGTKDGRWVFFAHRVIYESSANPGPSTSWTPIWSPMSPPIPSNFPELRKADPKLCDTEPGVSIAPKLTQAAYVAPDLSVILYPAGARNQRGTTGPGICISVDGGKRFHGVAFAGLSGDIGPLGVTCMAKRCLAYGGLDHAPDSSYIYYTLDASKGADSTWTKAKLPTLKQGSKFRSIALTSNDMNGWAVGTVDSASPLLLTTSDGGATWRDITSSIQALVQDRRLHTVYAFDATHLWIGGEKGILITTGN